MENEKFLSEQIITYLGNKRKETVYILSSEQKIETYKNHPFYKIDVIYYKDKSNKDLEITLEFINTEFEKTKENLIKLTDHLDKLEITYNTILKEYKNRNAR
jgi:hypothetical protein